jgi:hypothetical protein
MASGKDVQRFVVILPPVIAPHAHEVACVMFAPVVATNAHPLVPLKVEAHFRSAQAAVSLCKAATMAAAFPCIPKA